MKILSFDIGILNLAFCLADYNEVTKQLNIIEWKIINLLEDEIQLQNKCTHKSPYRPYKCCTKIANFKLKNNKEYYCKVHKKDQKKYIPNIIKIRDGYCEEQDCNKKANYRINNVRKCSSHKVQLLKYYKNYKLDKIKTIQCKDYPLDKIAEKLVTIMDTQYQYLLDCDVVLLELQPYNTAPKMKTISNYLYMWFHIRGKHDKNQIKEIKYYKATNKLKFDVNNTSKDELTYKNRKRTSIKNVNDYLLSINDEKNKILFQNHKKKDDLSDSLLQILSYFKSKNLL